MWFRPICLNRFQITRIREHNTIAALGAVCRLADALIRACLRPASRHRGVAVDEDIGSRSARRDERKSKPVRAFRAEDVGAADGFPFTFPFSVKTGGARAIHANHHFLKAVRRDADCRIDAERNFQLV